jgi:hypothetical protein
MMTAHGILSGVRNAFVIALALFILLAPGYKQVLNENEYWIPKWRMFSGKGLGILAVRFESEAPDGVRQDVPWEHFDPPEPPRGPVRAERLQTERDVRRKAQVLCRALGRGTAVYAYARKAVQSGWEPVLAGEENLCKRR